MSTNGHLTIIDSNVNGFLASAESIIPVSNIASSAGINILAAAVLEIILSVSSVLQGQRHGGGVVICLGRDIERACGQGGDRRIGGLTCNRLSSDVHACNARRIRSVCAAKIAILRACDFLTDSERDRFSPRRIGVRNRQRKVCRLRGIGRIGGGDGHVASLQSRHLDGAAAHAAVCVGRVGDLNLNDVRRGSRPLGADTVCNAQRQGLADFQRGRAAAIAVNDLELSPSVIQRAVFIEAIFHNCCVNGINALVVHASSHGTQNKTGLLGN